MRLRRFGVALLILTTCVIGVAIWLLVLAARRGGQVPSSLPVGTNGSFDHGLDGWRIPSDSVGRVDVLSQASAAPAPHFLRLHTVNRGKAEIFQEIAISPRGNQPDLVISADVRSSLRNGFGRLFIACLDTRSSADERKHYGQLALFTSSEVVGTTDWAKLRMPFSMPAGTDRIVLSVQAFGEGDVDITNIRIEASPPAGPSTRNDPRVK